MIILVNSHYLFPKECIDMVRRKLMLVTLGLGPVYMEAGDPK